MVVDQLSAAAPAARPLFVVRHLPRRLLMLAGGTLLVGLPAWLGAVGFGGTPGGALISLVAILVGVGLLLCAAIAPIERSATSTASPITRVGLVALWALIALSCVATAALVVGVFTSRSAVPYNSDAAAFNHYNAELVLHGVNPYTADGRFWDAVAHFPDAGATPLRAGRYAGSTFGPTLDEVVRDVRDELAHPATRGPEFSGASLHSYPALSFLVYVPALALGMANTVPTSLVFVAAYLVAAGWGAPRPLRPAIALLLLANALLISGTLRGSFEVVALLPVLLAWRALDRRWLSAALLGLGCAVKQVVWPLALLYTVIVWRRSGRREALVRLGITFAAFLAPNLPFLVASPIAWTRSLFLPMTLPIFPSGVGLVGLAGTGMLPLWPSPVYAILEILAITGLAIWFARAERPPRPAVALLVGLMPFLLAWHSLLAYVIALPALAVYACLDPLRGDIGAPDASVSCPTVV